MMPLAGTRLRGSPRSALVALVLALAVAASGPGCVSAPPPIPAAEGFVIQVQLNGIRSAPIDNIRLVIVPRVVGAVSPRFAPIEPYDAGGIQVSVDRNGYLTLTVSGDYVRANGVSAMGDLDPRIDVEVWSDDEVMREGPQIQGFVVIGGSQLAMSASYLPEWPLTLGGSAVLSITCTAGFETQCAPPVP